MRILAIDDQQMTLKAVENKLTQSGYIMDVANTAETGKQLFDSATPNLILLDVNLPDENGVELINYFKNVRGFEGPIMMMSGEKEEELIIEAFRRGAADFIQKPVSLNELVVRVQKSLNQRIQLKTSQASVNRNIQTAMVGVVVPCYNEETRLRSQAFQRFVQNNLGYHLCFVNDGSTDNTLEVLNELCADNPGHLSVYNCPKNGGKAEAVRLGMHYLLQKEEFDYLGYLDADLSTNFLDFHDLVETISSSDFQIVGGSRIHRMGADITKQGSRAIISKGINLIIRKILGMHFQDTQCGAKIMTKGIAKEIFSKKFLTSWLFDVEIFMRMKKKFGSVEAQKMICEQPLKRWIHEEGSKLSMKDSFKILGQLFQISTAYKKG